jgi:hypothetical protein
MNNTFAVGVDGSISASDKETRPSERESRIPNILEMIKDPNCSPGKVTRLVTEQIALLVQEMSAYEDDSALEFKLKRCSAQIEGLCAMEKMLQRSWLNCDGLNFDGPQFVIAFKGIGTAIRQAVMNATSNARDGLAIMEEIRDGIGRFESVIRGDTAKIRPNDPRARGTWADAIRSM